MHSLLKTTIEEPVTIQFSQTGKQQRSLGRRCRRRLRSMHVNSFDWEQGGLQSPVKFVDRDSIEYSLVQAQDNDLSETEMASLTLDNAMALLDPAWGGVYQYSTGGQWRNPHFQKTMACQTGHLRIYALAYAQFQRDRYLAVAQSIRAYMSRFLVSDAGAFYTGQSDYVPGTDTRFYFSLNDKERCQIGMPDIDRRIKTRENGWAIESLATLYEFSHDHCSLLMALRAFKNIHVLCGNEGANWLTSHMATTGNHLAEQLAMGRALLQLYRVTFKRTFLEYAGKTLHAIQQRFRHADSGYLTSTDNGCKQVPRQIDENISLARFANLMFYYKGESVFRDMAEHAFSYLSVFEIATSRMEEAGILLLEQELQGPPLTFYIETSAGDIFNNPFMDIAWRHPGWYKHMVIKQGDRDRVTVEIDGLRSCPVYTTERLQDLLNHC